MSIFSLSQNILFASVFLYVKNLENNALSMLEILKNSAEMKEPIFVINKFHLEGLMCPSLVISSFH